ncbi:MAG: hypothetical protein KKF62_01655 [Bacteroidetes bacterium]|nr:hypothetical protein [Bacteroidota bacterium]MBU1114359.1 hypothetical protein [Bacteroidota bacterium]MBU1797346.1 hypothetical protein [Bacteroidota bacterium]
MKKSLSILLLLSSYIFAQSYDASEIFMFFGRQPSAKTEAMGRILTLNYDSNFLTQSNPAALVYSKGSKIFFSHSSHVNPTDNSGGVSYNTNSIGAFAFNIQSIDWGGNIPTDKLYTFTYSNELNDWFSYGINANLFEKKYYGSTQSNTFFEIGILREFKLFQNTQIKDILLIGTQMKNIFNQKRMNSFGSTNYFPSIFRVGVSNVVEYTNERIYDKSHLIGFTSGFEYQDLFNSDSRTAYKFGGELSLLDIIYLRIGYYSETLRENSYWNKNLEEFTYGFGFNFNLEHYLNSYLPLSIRFDYVSLPVPSYKIINYRDQDFNTFNLIINYGF